MATTIESPTVQTTFHLQVTPEQTLALPDELLRQLGVAAGDVIAVSVYAGHGFLHKVEPAKLAQPVVTELAPELAGLLADYFTDHEDVMKFIEEERGPQPAGPPPAR